MKKITINTNSQKYPIIIGSKLISNLQRIIKNNSINFLKCLLVVDNNVPKEKIDVIKNSLKKKEIYIHYINATEVNKNQKNANKILEILLKKKFFKI